jgi:nudix-type nucleoside diphosphatase (YffH/AdpP family)
MQIVDNKIIYQGWGTFMVLSVRTASGEVVRRQLEDHGSAASVLPFDAARRVALLARLPRVGPAYHGLDPRVMEAAAGMIDDGEAADACARREAMEELGVRLDALDFVANCWPAAGHSGERVALYLAPYAAADRIAAGGGVEGENEEIEVLERPLADLARQADAGQIDDLKTLTLILALRLRRPELFAE